MVASSQNARWPIDAAFWSAVQGAAAAVPPLQAPTLPLLAGMAPLQAIGAVETLRSALAQGPALSAPAHAVLAALQAPPPPAAAPPAAAISPIDLAPFQATLDAFRAAERSLDRPAAVPATLPAPAPPGFLVSEGAAAAQALPGVATDGAVDYLQAQYIHAGDAGVSIGATRPDVFIKSGAGNDALAAQSGRNVLDGGRGSNFLVGGTGVDTYFIDGRGGQATWGTVVGFQPGEIITLWGFDPAVSRLTWAESEGAAGYTGRTLHADITGTGAASALVTIAGADAAAAGKWAITTGVEAGTPYLAIVNLG